MGIMKDTDEFIKAYRHFRESVDFSKSGFLPEVDKLVFHLLAGPPCVPAAEDPSGEGPMIAIDQKVAILKTVFVEVNRDQPKDFLDEGMRRYDEAGKMVKLLIKDSD